MESICPQKQWIMYLTIFISNIDKEEGCLYSMIDDIQLHGSSIKAAHEAQRENKRTNWIILPAVWLITRNKQNRDRKKKAQTTHGTV